MMKNLFTAMSILILPIAIFAQDVEQDWAKFEKLWQQIPKKNFHVRKMQQKRQAKKFELNKIFPQERRIAQLSLQKIKLRVQSLRTDENTRSQIITANMKLHVAEMEAKKLREQEKLKRLELEYLNSSLRKAEYGKKILISLETIDARNPREVRYKKQQIIRLFSQLLRTNSEILRNKIEIVKTQINDLLPLEKKFNKELYKFTDEKYKHLKFINKDNRKKRQEIETEAELELLKIRLNLDKIELKRLQKQAKLLGHEEEYDENKKRLRAFRR